MLYQIDDGKFVDYIPYEPSFRVWRSRLADQEYDAIVNELNRRIDSDEVHTSSWIPGSDWNGTVYEPIYTKACLRDESDSAKCFGLILWVVMMQRPEAWAFGHYEKDGIPIAGLTYFRVEV
jgi:hypothetical protein